MTARPGVGLHELYRPYLWLDSYQHEFETFKRTWLEYVPMLRNQNDGYLRDQLWGCVERDMIEALELKLGAERISQILSSQLMVEIERISVQKQCDVLNKIKLFEPNRSWGNRSGSSSTGCASWHMRATSRPSAQARVAKRKTQRRCSSRCW